MPLDSDAESSRVHLLEDEEEQEDGDEQPEDQRNKRRRTDAGRFPAGSIIRLAMKNFVTYTAAEFFPGPNMNLVIGPNGSGKSTIVCAICLGLGYRPDVLGRATAVGDFVQHGKEVAEIEIELATDSGSSIVVKRKIKRDKNQSTYYLNGKQDTLAKVQELMASFNIQIDNLCQFLPQDRVASFAQLSPIQLLHETQRAVGGDEMVAHWERLCALRAEERELQAAAQNDANNLANLNQKQATAQVTVDRLHKRNEIIARIEKLKLRIPIAKYSAAQAEHRRLKEVRNALKAEADRLQERDKPLKDQASAYEARKLGRLRLYEKATESLAETMKKVKACDEKSGQFEDEAAARDTEIRRINKLVGKRKAKLEELKSDIKKLEHTEKQARQKLERLGPDDSTEVEAELAKNTEETRRLRPLHTNAESERRDLESQLRDAVQDANTAKDKLVDFNSLSAQRLAMLNKHNSTQQDRDTHEVIKWLQAGGKDRFQNTVFDPPLLSLGIKDPSLSKIANSCFRKNDLLTFTCLSREDYELFSALVVDNKEKIFSHRMGVRAVENSKGKQFKDWESPVSTEQLKSLGFECWLKDLITGPEEVINTLCHLNQIHAVAISRRDFSAKQCEAVVNLTTDRGYGPVNLIEKYTAGNFNYTLTRSKYGQRNVTTLTNFVKEYEYFSTTVDPEKKTRLERDVQQLQDRCRQLSAEGGKKRTLVNELGAQLDQLNAARTSLQGKRNIWKMANNAVVKAVENVRAKKRQYEEEEAEPDTTEELLAEVEQQQAEAAHERMENATSMTEYIKEAVKKWERVVLSKIQALQATADAEKIQVQVGNQTQELGAAQTKYNDAANAYTAHGAVAKALQNAVHAYVTEKEFDEELVAQYVREAVSDPISVDELEETLIQEESSLRINSANSAVGVLELYEKRVEEIKTIEARIEARQTELDTVGTQITTYRKIWEAPLEKMVKRVSTAFSNAFTSIGCAGEVLLSKKVGDNQNTPDTDDFEKWSIEIKVKFRQTEELQLLTGQRQSGGERSVSTIFYLMALQDMAKAPFRVVDEINQGMDPRNERLVHSRMVDAACLEGRSQYFLITPKLLPGLKYHPNMKILTINNGKLVPSALDVGTYITRARALQDSL